MKKIIVIFYLTLPFLLFGQNKSSNSYLSQDSNIRIDSLQISIDILLIENNSLTKKINAIEESFLLLKENHLIEITNIKSNSNKLNFRIDSLKISNNEIIERLIKKIDEKVSANQLKSLQTISEKQINILRSNLSKNSISLDSFNVNVLSNKNTIRTQANNVEITNKKVEQNNQYILIGLLIALILLIISFIIYKITNNNKKKIVNTNNSLEEIIDLDKNLIQITEQQSEIIRKHLGKGGSSDDETLKSVKMVADEITTMENNIFYMDKSTRGLKKIVRAITNLRNNFRIMGYEIPVLLGTEWTEGDIIEVVAEIPDESIEEGKKIITKVNTPRIDKGGVMIQRAKVEIKYNI